MRKHWVFAILTLLSFFFFQPEILAQVKTVTGTVRSESDGTTLPGVNIIIKGTGEGTITNAEGQFSIDVKSEDVLVVSFIGFKTQEVSVGDRLMLNISLVEDISELDEVVVIGYGTQKKKLVTGATDQVKGEALEQRNATTAISALQGMTPGVNITSTSGQPGEPSKVIIRGRGTIGDPSPLYIVDGVPMDNIDFLNPADIENIDVLKDAASAAIYGNRGANGVILVTTRQGSRVTTLTGKPTTSMVTFDAYYGFQNRAKKVNMLNTDEYVEIINEQYLNSGGSPSKLPFDANNLPAYTKDGAANTNWLDEMFVKNAATQNYVLGAMGTSDAASYSMSFSYTGQEGIVGGKDLSDYNRYGARINTSYDLFKGVVRVGENLNFAYVKSRGIKVGDQYGNTLRGAFNVSPLMPVYDDNGEYFNTADKSIVDQFGETYWNNAESNPYAGMYYSNQNMKNTQRIVGNVFAEINILKNLQLRTAFGINHYTDDEHSFTPIYTLSIYNFSNFSKATQSMHNNMTMNLDNLLTYTYESDKHRVVAMIGNTVYKYSGVYMYGENVDIAFNDLAHAYLNNATNTSNPAQMKIEGKPEDEEKILSYFGRVQYDFKETYLFNFTFRADGSSKFAEENRWGYFPSVSAGWVMTNEAFMDGIVDVVNFFKLRASWGQNGSSNAKAYQYLAPIKFTQATYAFGDEEGVSLNGSYPSRLSNTDLKWETSEQLDIGFDSRIWKSKLAINFDWYRKVTKDWIILAPIYATAGTDAPYINGGDVINKGVELALTYNGKSGNFNYSLGINGAYNKNMVQNVPTEDGIIHGATNTLYNNAAEFYRAESGHAIGYFWGWETNGIFQTTDEVAQYVNSEGKKIQPSAKPGDLKYVDQNGDGVIDDLDKIDLGDPNPDFMYGLNFSCSFKGFDFLLIGTGVAGNQIVQSYRSQTDKYANYSTEILDRWTGPGTSNTIPRVTEANINYKFSDIYVKNGSYFRISNLTLGYDFMNIIKSKIFNQLRLYVSVQNLYTFTSYSGMDPEIGYGFDYNTTKSYADEFSSGIDLGFYPHPRTILIGLNVKI